MYKNIELMSVDSDGYTRVRVIPVEALASWGELLGLKEPSEILSAIVYVQNNGEPPLDENGESVWAKSYRALALRETVKAQELKKAEEEGTASDPRSPALRGALAALAVKPIVEEAQEAVRRELLPDQMSNVAPLLPLTASSLQEQKAAFLDSVTSIINPG